MFSLLIFGYCAVSFTSGQNFQVYDPTSVPINGRYGPGYGTDWIFFPDEDGIPHYVSLSEDVFTPRMGFFNLPLEDIEFRYYYGKHNLDYILLDVNADTSNTSFKFTTGAPVKIITHGWRSSSDGNAVLDIVREYMKTLKYNVLTIDWSDIAHSPWYPGVAEDTKAVGDYVGKFISKLGQKYGVTGNMIHLIGHSLGAHVMGNAALACGLRISRITGLDPARPLFELPSRSADRRLDTTDADFVDAIHTCGGILGFQDSIGHADFYPNGGGAPQPGCGTVSHMFETCSHGRAFVYFAESVNHPQAFHARKCDNWPKFAANQCQDNRCYYMGDHINNTVQGTFYLSTNPQPMYGKEICT